METHYLLKFSRNAISKDLLNNEVWKEQVEPVFESRGLTCTMNEDERTMNLVADYTEDKVIIDRATRALIALASGLNADWVEPIFLGKIYCEKIMLEKPDGMSEEKFSSNYDDFINKIENKKLYDEWRCSIIYFEKSMTVLATSSQAIRAMESLVKDSLYRRIPFEEIVDTLTREIVTYDQEQHILTNNLRLFCSLLQGINVDALLGNEETHRSTCRTAN